MTALAVSYPLPIKRVQEITLTARAYPMANVAGWFGKIPFLGDFASRRLSEDFISEWDSWLQHSIAASRASLGEHWLEIYLTSPLWRFVVMPDVVGHHAWAGVLMPSVDSVGRH